MNTVFVDNRDGNTLQKAIIEHLGTLRENRTIPDELCIASAYFNPQGLELIADEAKYVKNIKLLLGAEPAPEALIPRRKPQDPPEPRYSKRRIQAALRDMEKGLRNDRNLLPFDIETDSAIHRLLQFLKSGKIEVKRYEGHFLHAKAYIFRGSNRGLFAGSSNLTVAGLKRNLELNLGHYTDPLVGKVEAWYDELWEEASPFDLAKIYEELLVEYSPYLIYLKVLWHLYGDELGEEVAEPGYIPVTTFQKHGVWRARRILEKYGGVLIADGVGLGKTFLAGELIQAYRDRRQRVLLVCPAALRDSNWKQFLHDYQLFVETVSYEQLANDVQFEGDSRHLKSPIDEYALVVIDEAHNYRNPDTPSRAAVLRQFMSGKRRDLVLLSATPVNNSLWDLYHILRYFLKQDAALSNRGVLSIRERFHEATQIDPFNLNPDLLYPIIDSTTVKRTRRFVKKHYSNDTIRGPGGVFMPILFPKPHAISIDYNLDEALPGFFERFQEILMPENGYPLLHMARYKPENYPADKEPLQQDTALVGLLRSGLLKRFESSTYAFYRTTKKMADEHKVFLETLERGKVIRKEFLRELSAADDEADIDELLETSEHVEDTEAFNIVALRDDVEKDLELLQELSKTAATIQQGNCPKLAVLVKELMAIVKKARSESFDEEGERQNRKVLIFSYFEDTIDWVEGHLRKVIDEDKSLSCYRGRIASVSGAEFRHGIRREKAIHGFAPISSGALPRDDKDLYDILLCTDVLAEGMNLQQCRNIINYDLPWNPMRLIQRHGRIDRIGSPHKHVYLQTFFPDVQLDELLNLEERVRRKLAQAAASVGVEVTPIEYGATGEQSFSETRTEIERLRHEDSSIYERGGTESAAQTGEEYRQELRKGIERRAEDILMLPWKAGSGMVRGSLNGHFFFAEVGDRNFLRFVPLTGSQDDIITEIGTCLRLIECDEDTPHQISLEMAESVFDAWKMAKKSIFEAWNFETDPANLQPKIRKLNREVAGFLRKYPPLDIDQERLNQCLDAVESPWSRREENQLRIIFKQEHQESHEKSRALIDEIERIGVEPFKTPEPLPPIDPEEIHLICWIAIQADRESV